MNQMFFVLCGLGLASASPEHRTRDRQTLLPYPIPFGQTSNPYSAILPSNQVSNPYSAILPSSNSPTSVPYVIKAQPPSPYSSAWPFPSRPYSTPGPFKYIPSMYESPSTYSPQSHEMYTPPPSYWPYPTQVFYASQYYPQHSHRPDTPTHHMENSHHPSPTYSTAKPLKPHDSYHIEISPQHTTHNHEESNPSTSPLHHFHHHDSPSYHNTHEESNHSPPHTSHTPLRPHPHDTTSHLHHRPNYHNTHEDAHKPLHPHPHDTTSHLHHSVHYLNPHGASNSNPLYSTPKPPQGLLTTEHLLQFLQNPHFRAGNLFPPPPQPPRVMILQPLETHSGGASGINPEGDTIQSPLPLTRRNTEAGEGRGEPHRAHVLWETMYRPIRWEHKWYPKWNVKHHLWNTKWWMPWKKVPAAPHHDPHLALEPWDHVTVHHAPPPSSNPYLGISHYPYYHSKQPLSSNHQPEGYFEANHHPHTLDTYLQHDEPWTNKHLLEKLLHDNNNNKQSYQHTRDPAQYYHHMPTNPGYNIYSLPGNRQLKHRPSSAPWVGAQGPDTSPGDPEGRLVTEPEHSQLSPPHEEAENDPQEAARQHDVGPESRYSSVDDVIEYQPEGRVMSPDTEQWLPPDQSQDVVTLPLTTSSDDVVDARPRDFEVIGQPAVHPWLPPSYLPSMTSRGGRQHAQGHRMTS